MDDMIITPEVAEKWDGKEVPLVVYRNGNRYVVGTAKIDGGKIEAELDQPIPSTLSSIILSGDMTGYSIKGVM